MHQMGLFDFRESEIDEYINSKQVEQVAMLSVLDCSTLVILKILRLSFLNK